MRRFSAAHVVLVPLLALAASCPSTPPQSRAFQIAKRDQLIGGPRALGEVGDWMIENSKVRFIIQDAGFSRGFGVFGGALLDADLVREQSGVGSSDGGTGRDNFGEMFPAFFLEALDPREVRDPNDPSVKLPPIEIENDGSDGKAAVLVVRGLGGDFIALTETVNEVLLGDDRRAPALQFETRYVLEPGANYVTMTTKVQNITVPAETIDLRASFGGADIPTPFGDVMLFGAGNSVFAPTPAGFDIRFTLDDIYAAGEIPLPAIPGIAAEFIASAGKDVSYGLLPVPPEAPTQNFVQANAGAFPGATDHSVHIPFIASAFTGVFQALPPPELTPNDNAPGGTDEMTFSRHFIVGDGDVASISDTVYDLLGDEVGSVSGRLRHEGSGEAVVGASVVVVDANGGKVTQMKTDEGGRFAAKLRPGTYSLVSVEDGYASQTKAGVEVEAKKNTHVEVSLPLAAVLVVNVVEAGAGRVPAKVSLVGTTPDDHVGDVPRTWLFDLSVGEEFRFTDFVPDVAGDDATLKYIEHFAYTKDGAAEMIVRPGTYTVVVSRGMEYDRTETAVTLEAGKTTVVNTTLARVVDTTGYVGADFHLHSVFSLDSNANLNDRVASFVGEGLEIAVSTDHNFIVDYQPTIEKLGMQRFLNSVVGLELTTIDRGHFNGFPLDRGSGALVADDEGNIDTIASRTYGSLEWALRDPQAIFDELRTRGHKNAAGDVQPIVLQVNHPRDSILGYFDQYGVNADTLEVEGQGGAILGPDLNTHPEFRKEAFSFDFDAVEVFNGKHFEFLRTFRVPAGVTRDPASCCPVGEAGEIFREFPGPECGDDVLPELCNCTPAACTDPTVCDEREAAQVAAGRCDVDDAPVGFPGVVEDWLKLLASGRRVIGTANSDSHEPEKDEPGSPRTYLRVPSDDPAQVGPDDIVAAFTAGDVLMTNGPFVRVSIGDKGMGQTVTGGAQTLVVKVDQAPWVKADTINVLVNGTQVASRTFTGRTAEESFDVDVDVDGFIVVEVTSPSDSATLFPTVFPAEVPPLNFTDVIGSLGSSFGFSSVDGALKPATTFVTRPYALTNPIYVDVDGDGDVEPSLFIPGQEDVAGDARTAGRAQRPTPTVGNSRVMVTVPTEVEARMLAEKAMWEALPLKRKVALSRLPRWLWPSNEQNDIRRALVQFVRHSH